MNAVTGFLMLALLGAETPAPKRQNAAGERWDLSLREAIRIGLENAEGVRVVALNASGNCGDVPAACGASSWSDMVIAPVDPHASPYRAQAETMAMVRSIEQQYWALAQQHAQLWASERAVEIAREIVKREQAELPAGRGTVADAAEAEQRLEQFSLDLVTKTSDVITAERQLRNILGLPPADNRRIVPTTAAVAVKLEPDWQDSLETMLTAQPDVAERRMLVCASGLQYLAARGPAALVAALGFSDDAPLGPDARQAWDALEQQRTLLRQTVHQTTHALARFFLELDANYKQFKTASRLRTAAAQRLEAQRVLYEQGRIPVDRYLDAVSQYAAGVAQEAQFKTSYNVSLVALEEAKGTLLSHHHIALAERPEPALRLPEFAAAPKPAADPDVKKAGAEGAPGAPAPKTVTFDVTIGEARPIRVRGTFTVTGGEAATPAVPPRP